MDDLSGILLRPIILHHGEGGAGDAWQFDLCGLDNVFLTSGYSLEWIDGEEYLSIQDPDGLHAAIGFALVARPGLLQPKEIRYLRRYLRLTQGALAGILGCDGQTVARYEKGQSEINGAADRLLRLLFLEREGQPRSIGWLCDRLEHPEKPDPQPVTLSGGWQLAAA